MKLVDDFLNIAKELDVDTSTMYQEKHDEYQLLTFKEEISDGVVFHIVFIFYNDEENVEVYVRQKFESVDELKILKALNQLNARYSGLSFYLDEDYVCTKSLCMCDHKIEPVIATMMQQIDSAKTEFAALK